MIIIVYNRRVLQCFVTDEVDCIVANEDELNWEIKGMGRDSLPKETRPLDRWYQPSRIIESDRITQREH